ncbi:MAG TPA: hypothetical protein VMN99_03630 [Anaerolineales bacterium]|nr:hypothetical protein [Anaerolineales bacterium]
MEQLDRLSELYTGRRPHFDECVPAEFQEKETPVLCRILPASVTALDAGCEKQEQV